MNGYKRVKEGVFRLEIKRSEFIAYTYAAESEEEAKRRLADVRQAHREARHVCFAYVCGADGGIVRFSDDGEPGGTAGKPILDVLQKNALKNSLIAVVRYFGGILLGAGGLTRAYSDSAAGAVKSAGCVYMREKEVYIVTADYSTYEKIAPRLKKYGEMIEIGYGQSITARYAFEPGADMEALVKYLCCLKAAEEFVCRDYFQSEEK